MSIQKSKLLTQETASNIFIIENEQLLASFGNDSIDNYLSNGTLYKGFMIMSDKRIYVKGNHLVVDTNDKLSESNEDKVIELTDVRDIKFKERRPLSTFIPAMTITLISITVILLYIAYNIVNYPLGVIYFVNMLLDISGFLIIAGAPLALISLFFWWRHKRSTRNYLEIIHKNGVVSFSTIHYSSDETKIFVIASQSVLEEINT